MLRRWAPLVIACACIAVVAGCLKCSSAPETPRTRVARVVSDSALLEHLDDYERFAERCEAVERVVSAVIAIKEVIDLVGSLGAWETALKFVAEEALASVVLGMVREMPEVRDLRTSMESLGTFAHDLRRAIDAGLASDAALPELAKEAQRGQAILAPPLKMLTIVRGWLVRCATLAQRIHDLLDECEGGSSWLKSGACHLFDKLVEPLKCFTEERALAAVSRMVEQLESDTTALGAIAAAAAP